MSKKKKLSPLLDRIADILHKSGRCDHIKGRRVMSGEKLELKFEITSWTDDVAEGAWHGHDTDGWLQSMAVESIEKWVVLLVEFAFDEKDATHPWIKEGRLKLDFAVRTRVELYCEDGRAIGDDTSSGLFVAYRDGIPR